MSVPSLPKLLRDQRGAIMLEYIVIIGGVALVVAPALLLCGWGIMGNFAFTRTYLLYPYP